jgi:flagellar motor switch protein FliN/FliY
MDAQQPAGQTAIPQWLQDTWGACLAKVIEGMTGERPELRPLSPSDAQEEAAADAGKPLVWEQEFDLGPGATLWVAFPEEAWSALGARALRAAGVEEVSPEEIKGTCLELLTQCHAAVAQLVGERLERTVLATTGREVDGLPGGVPRHSTQIRYQDAALAPVQLAFAASLAAALREPDPVQNPEPQQPPAAGLPDPHTQASATLDLLRDVELPVSVSFGRAQLALRDVLKLAAGSVIELDRSIDEPVALIVNNTVVALGDVVVVEGNYGLRIQQIMSRERLLRSSGVV